MSEAPESIEVPVWWVSGGMMVRRDALEHDHPEQTYNYIKRTYGVAPEAYGIFAAPRSPYTEQEALEVARERYGF